MGWKSKLRAGSARESLQGRWRRPNSPSASRLYSAARAATCLLRLNERGGGSTYRLHPMSRRTYKKPQFTTKTDRFGKPVCCFREQLARFGHMDDGRPPFLFHSLRVGLGTGTAPLVRLAPPSTTPSVRPASPHGPVRFARAWSRSSSRSGRPPTGRPCTAGALDARPSSRPRSSGFRRCSDSASSNSSAERLRRLPRPRPAALTRPEPSTPPRRPRGQQRGKPGPKRRDYSHLPAVVEDKVLPPDQCRCSRCGQPFADFPGTEDSIILEIEVRAHRRVIRRRRYRPTCSCAAIPASSPPRRRTE